MIKGETGPADLPVQEKQVHGKNEPFEGGQHNTVYVCVGPSVRRDSPIPGFSDKVSLCSPGWSKSYRDPPAS